MSFPTASSAPYNRPQPLRLKFVALKKQPKVITWLFNEQGCQPGLVKSNQSAAVTDGKTGMKITLMEAIADRVTEGKTYIVRGYAMGRFGGIIIKRDTQLYATAPLEVSAEARKLINPPSPYTPLRDKVVGKMITVEGKVIQLSSVKKFVRGDEVFSLTNITIEQDGTTANLALWREAAIEKLTVGQVVRVTHMKGNLHASYGWQLQSTASTSFEEVSSKSTIIEIIGVLLGEGESAEVLLTDNSTLKVTRKVWEVVGWDLPYVPFPVEVTLLNGEITEVKLPSEL